MKSKYETNVEPYLEAIEQMARNGMMEKDIAKKLNIAWSTWWTYKKQYPNLSNALRTNREIADLAIENALWRSAKGYDKTTIDRKYAIVRHDDGTTERVLLEEKEKIEHVPPNPVSIQYYLNHRLSGAWGDISTTDEQTGGVIEIPERLAGSKEKDDDRTET